MANVLFDGLLGKADPEAQFAYIPTGAKPRWYSYADVLDVSARFSQTLTDLGVKPGDRVAVQVAKSIEAVMLYLAAVRTGAVFLPLNTAYTATEVEYFLTDATPALFLCDPARQSEYEVVTDKLGVTLETFGVWDGDDAAAGTFFTKTPEAGHAFETVPRSKDDLAAILYTSGTTGRSKGAMLSHENLLSNSLALRDFWRFTKNDVLLHALPIFHTHGLFVATNIALLSGASLIFLPGFNADHMIEHLPDATAMMGVPTFYTRLLADDRFDKDLVSHMRLFVSGSAPLLAETHVEFEARTGHRILERYGMTETNMNTSNPYDGERRAGTVGFPLPEVDVRIVDAETAEEVNQGETGIIEVRGPNVFSGYWQMPEKTKQEFREDGFFITGDVGRVDEDGYVHIVGREKDLIISGGYNIYPKEIELLLDEQDGVLESAVIGTPHADFGEAVVGVVVAKPGAALDEQTIMANLNGALARFKQPKRLIVVDELPRNAMGKVQKNVLRDQYKALFDA